MSLLISIDAVVNDILERKSSYSELWCIELRAAITRTICYEHIIIREKRATDARVSKDWLQYKNKSCRWKDKKETKITILCESQKNKIAMFNKTDKIYDPTM